MAEEGSYTWWRENYQTDLRYQGVCNVLTQIGVDCSQTEVDHFPPNISYSGSSYTWLSYGNRPAFPLPKYLHRFHRGDGGMGGHISTTGSTSVAKYWSGELRGYMRDDDYYGAMRQDIIDKQNVALSATGNRHFFDPILFPAICLARKLGLISHGELYEILVNQMNSYGL